ncbi:N-acetylmuramoyl-L-alanine amidase [Streptomyces sp. NPDC014986]|uniref:peptidoglycan recognition protein family protein n=1 Tax=Streptomyces sp. NPDC014986 TaxID=3364934 RepID=UPI0037018C72
MAWYPDAVKMELQPESDGQAAIRPTQFIVHSIVAPWTARRTYEYWRDSTNLESHFGIDYAGTVGQYIGTETRADANAGANRRPDGTGAVSAETASNTSGSDPWNDKQIEDLIALGVWLHEEHGIPLRICRTHDDPGYGYHSQFREWSTSGTACPGAARIKQWREVVFPAIVARATGKTPDPSTEEDMPLASSDLKKIRDAVWTDDFVAAPDSAADRKTNPTWQPASYLKDIGNRVRSMDSRLAAQSAAITELTKTVTALATNSESLDADALVARIEQAIESIDVRLEASSS